MGHKSQLNLSYLLNQGSHVNVTWILKTLCQYMRAKQMGLPSTRVRQEIRHVCVGGESDVNAQLKHLHDTNVAHLQR